MRVIESYPPRPLNLLSFGPDGLLTAAGDGWDYAGFVGVWAVTGERVLAYQFEGRLLGLAFAPNGRCVFVLDDGVTAIDPRTAESLACQDVPLPTAFAVYPDSQRVLVASRIGRGRLECWRLSVGQAFVPVWETLPDASGDYWATAAGPTGERVAAVERGEAADGRPRQEAVLRNADTGAVTARVALDPADAARQLAFTTDGAKLLVRTDSRIVKLFDAASGAAAGELVHPRRPFVTAVAAHPRGPVACARADGTVTFWDAERREPLRTLDWKAGKLVSLAFSPDGALAAAGTEDGKIVVWDVDV